MVKNTKKYTKVIIHMKQKHGMLYFQTCVMHRTTAVLVQRTKATAGIFPTGLPVAVFREEDSHWGPHL